MKQIWLVQTRCRNPVNYVKHIFPKIDTKSFKHSAEVDKFSFAMFISCIISGWVAVGVST